MKMLQKLGEEIVPLSMRQGLSLLIFIVMLFQFALFYGPVLADYAVKQAEAASLSQDEEIISLDQVSKAGAMDQEAAKLAESTASSSPEIKVIRTSRHVITAYNSEAAQTDASPCITANGFNVCNHGEEDTIAANFLKFGTKVQIPELFGDRVFVVRDRMNKRHSDRVDVWMKDRSDAIKFGVKVAEIRVVEIN